MRLSAAANRGAVGGHTTRYTLLLLLLVFLTCQDMVEVTAQASAGPCPGVAGSGITGYTTVAAMDADQRAELNRIRDGGTPNTSYVFTICPGQALDFTGSSSRFRPVLDGSIFTCGTTGRVEQDCMFVGGEIQILIQDSAVAGYPLQKVEFRGITFTAFTGAAIAGGASARTTVHLNNVVFEDFMFVTAVVIQGPDDIASIGPAFRVKVLGARIASGTADSVFLNQQGADLSLEQIQVTDVTAAMFVLVDNRFAASANTETSISETDVSNSSIDTVVLAAGAMVKIESMNVHNMNDIRAIVSSFEFSEVDYGFFGNSSRIYDNNLDRGWIPFEAGASGSINVEGVTLEGNSGVRFVALASEGSIIVLDLVNINDVVAEQTNAIVTAIFLADDFSVIASVNNDIISASGFTTIFFASAASAITMQGAILEQIAGLDTVAFVDGTSGYAAIGNFVGSISGINACDGTSNGNWVTVEVEGSGCFETEFCDFGCESFDVLETPPMRPTISPTPAPIFTTILPTFGGSTIAPSAPSRIPEPTPAPTPRATPRPVRPIPTPMPMKPTPAPVPMPVPMPPNGMKGVSKKGGMKNKNGKNKNKKESKGSKSGKGGKSSKGGKDGMSKRGGKGKGKGKGTVSSAYTTSVSYSAIAPTRGSLLVNDARPVLSRPRTDIRYAPTVQAIMNMSDRMPGSGRNKMPAVTIPASQFLFVATDENDSSSFGINQVLNITVASMPGGRSHLYGSNDNNENADDHKNTMIVLLIAGVGFVIAICIIRFGFWWRQQQSMVDYQQVHQAGQDEQQVCDDADMDGIRAQERAWERANERLSQSLQTRSDGTAPMHIVRISS